ncbi:hypothetical protein QF017_001231 [Pseudomonas laurylsulfatiphila]
MDIAINRYNQRCKYGLKPLQAGLLPRESHGACVSEPDREACDAVPNHPSGRNINTANGGKFNTNDNACPWLGVSSAVAPPLLP